MKYDDEVEERNGVTKYQEIYEEKNLWYEQKRRKVNRMKPFFYTLNTWRMYLYENRLCLHSHPSALRH